MLHFDRVLLDLDLVTKTLLFAAKVLYMSQPRRIGNSHKIELPTVTIDASFVNGLGKSAPVIDLRL
jgi:hypothetical protein